MWGADAVPRSFLKVTRCTAVKHGAPVALQGKVARMVQSLKSSFLVSAEPEPEEPAERTFVSEEIVAGAIEAWRQRTSYLPRELLSDPAWGMLLELLQAEIQDRRASLPSLCKVSAVPPSTAARLLKTLERQSLVVRWADPLHPNDEIVELSRKGSSALRRYFHEVVQTPGPFKNPC